MMEMKVAESGIEMSRICNFLACTEQDITAFYNTKSLDTELLVEIEQTIKVRFLQALQSAPDFIFAAFSRNKKRRNPGCHNFARIYTPGK